MSDVLGIVAVQFLMDEVADPNYLDHVKLYMTVLLVGVCWLMKGCLFNNLLYESALVATTVKHGMMLMMFEHISRLSQNRADSQELGKITNMFSSDFNKIETNISSLGLSIGLPIKVLGVTVVLVYRLGWIGILIMGLIVLFSVAEALVGKLAASCQVEVNKQKDERMRACIELL